MMAGVECAVCHVVMEKTRVHYGGVSCYSCRAFFRRTTQREELAKCKFQGNCKVDHMERKSCPPCRYDRCLRTGMRPDLVLDEEDKKKRFKKFQKIPEGAAQSREKNSETNANIDNLGPPEAGNNNNKREIGLVGVSANPKRKHQKKPENVSSSVGFTTLPTFDFDEEDEESREEEFLEFVKETAGATNVQKILSDLAENESVIDPETGMLSSGGYRLSTEPNLPTDNIPVLDPSPSKRRRPFNLPRGPDPPQLDEDEQIIKYIHKEFRSPAASPGSDSSSDNNPVIKRVNISSPAPLHATPCSVIQQRRSVIVRRGNNPVIPINPPDTTTIEIEFENLKDKEDLEDYGENSVVKLSLNIAELENLFTHEERKYFSHSLSQFVNTLQAVHLGEQLMNMYTSFCQNREILPVKFISFISSALREKMLNFITSLDEMTSLPTDLQFKLLSKRLPEAVVMAKVWGFNVRDVEDEISLVFTKRDMSQFHEQRYGAQGVKIGEILKYSPLPDAVKRSLIGKLKSSSHSILGDRTVFMLIVILLFFDDPDHQVMKIRNQFIHVLRRYLSNFYDPGLTDHLMATVLSCLRLLPALAFPFRQMEARNRKASLGHNVQGQCDNDGMGSQMVTSSQLLSIPPPQSVSPVSPSINPTLEFTHFEY